METTKPTLAAAQPDAARATLFRNVYLWMTMALALTALTAYTVAGSETLLQAIFSSRFVFLGLIVAELVLVFVLAANIMRMSFLTATLTTAALTALMTFQAAGKKARVICFSLLGALLIGQFFLPGQIGGQAGGNLLRRPLQKAIQAGVLAAQGRPRCPRPPPAVSLRPPSILPPLGKRGRKKNGP